MPQFSPLQGDSDLEKMRTRVAMPYVKEQVQGAAMGQFKQQMKRLLAGSLRTQLVSWTRNTVDARNQAHNDQLQSSARNQQVQSWRAEKTKTRSHAGGIRMLQRAFCRRLYGQAAELAQRWAKSTMEGRKIRELMAMRMDLERQMNHKVETVSEEGKVSQDMAKGEWDQQMEETRLAFQAKQTEWSSEMDSTKQTLSSKMAAERDEWTSELAMTRETLQTQLHTEKLGWQQELDLLRVHHSQTDSACPHALPSRRPLAYICG